MEKKPWRLNSLFNRFDVTRRILRPQFFFFAVSDLLKRNVLISSVEQAEDDVCFITRKDLLLDGKVVVESEISL